MAMLQLRPKCRKIKNPNSITLFSSSSSPFSSNPDPNLNENKSSSEHSTSNQQPKQQSFSSYFSDVKSTLKNQQQQQQHDYDGFNFQPYSLRRHNRPTPSALPSSSDKPPASFDEIRKNLSQFRIRSPTLPPVSPLLSPPTNDSSNGGAQHVSFQDLYKKSVTASNTDSGLHSQSPSPKAATFSAIRSSLRQLEPQTGGNAGWRGGGGSSTPLLDRIRMQQRNADVNSGPGRVIGLDSLQSPIFDKERVQRVETNSSEPSATLIREYGYEELGEKLRMLRPPGGKKPEGEIKFSFAEMQERLVKLREIELSQSVTAKATGIQYGHLRDSLLTIKLVDEEKNKSKTTQRINFLNLGTEEFMKSPPKEELIEKYFHPDNMSAAEKMKIKLREVREEFKMSESDCGSSRVQVALLTTKINYLSTTLDKKDKHSRKGLHDMVEKRKKLLKYLRRTDWDSYCFLLTKLGLKDNPGYKLKT